MESHKYYHNIDAIQPWHPLLQAYSSQANIFDWGEEGFFNLLIKYSELLPNLHTSIIKKIYFAFS